MYLLKKPGPAIRNAMPESVHIFDRYVAGDEAAADELFYRYIERLTRLARSRLSASLQHRVDAEDIVMSAYRSFFIGARDGRFAIERSGALWSLLVRITLNKLYRSASHHTAQRRSITREAPLSRDVATTEPSIADAVALADEVEALMRELPEKHRRILELRLQGELIEAIAEKVEVNERTVRRAIETVRAKLVRSAGLPAEWAEVLPKHKPPRPGIAEPLLEASLRYSDFILERQVGIGGMGRVYRATRKSDGAVFAVKYLRKSFLTCHEAVRRFAREASIVTSLEHPNIVGVSGFGKTEAGGFFIAMDFVQGTDLATIAQGSAQTPKQIAAWLLPICDALKHAHLRQVVHCDLKPANILIRDDGVPILTDFGLARRVADGGGIAGLCGTAPFMAPEQVDEAFGTIGTATDVYGLGALLFTVATGRPPFVGDNAVDIMAAVAARREPLRPSSLRLEAACFDQICARCMCPIEDRLTIDQLVGAFRESVPS